MEAHIRRFPDIMKRIYSLTLYIPVPSHAPYPTVAMVTLLPIIIMYSGQRFMYR